MWLDFYFTNKRHQRGCYLLKDISQYEPLCEEAVNRGTDNTMAKRYQRGNQRQ
jgi:hypothetical protein